MFLPSPPPRPIILLAYPLTHAPTHPVTHLPTYPLSHTQRFGAQDLVCLCYTNRSQFSLPDIGAMASFHMLVRSFGLILGACNRNSVNDEDGVISIEKIEGHGAEPHLDVPQEPDLQVEAGLEVQDVPQVQAPQCFNYCRNRTEYWV